MTKTEFLGKTNQYHGSVNGWNIVLGKLDLADFVIGCYYDESDKKWKVYENDERGLHGTRLETTSEERAWDKLYAMIEFENEVNLRNKALDARRKNQT